MAKTFNVKTVFTSKDKTSLVMKNISSQASKTVSQLGKIGLVAGAAIGTVGTLLLREASKIEDITASFQPMMGSFKKAEELVSELNKTAATTPFQLENISASATQLLPAMNGNIQKTIQTFRMLGDTAGGNVEKLQRISSVYSRVLLKNKLETGDLNILTERGIPIYKELSKSMGVSVQEMAKMASQGKITGSDLTKAFQNMTSEGGIFYKGMEIASQTLTGRLSTLKDNFLLTAASLGSNLLPAIKPLVIKVTDLTVKIRGFVEANKELIQTKLDVFVKNATVFFTNFYKVSKTTYNIFIKFLPLIKAIAVGFVAYKLAIIGAVVAQKAYIAVLAFGKFIKFIRIVNMMAKAKGIATAVQWAWNAAMTANPVGIIIVAIGVLIGLIFLLVKNWETIKAVMVNAIKMAWEWIQKFIAKIVELWDIFKGLLLPFAAPFVILIEVLRSVFSHWSKIKEAFTNKGFLGGILEIGKAIISGILAPIKSLLKLLAKIPGLKKIAGAGLELTNSLDQKIGMGDMSSPETSAISKVSDKTVSSKSTVDINVNDKNNNADVEQKGNLQGINFTLNQGVQ